MNSSSAKRKITQNDLRQLMLEKKRKLQQDHTRKIESPLAKYQPDGTLLCIICDCIVKNEAFWSVHINAKQHKDNIDRKKISNRQEVKITKPLKRPVPIVPTTQPSHSPPKKIKSILKNKIEPNSSTSQIHVGKTVNLQENLNHGFQMEVDNDSSVETDPKDEDLPEGFFDDPVLDAKARHVDYKDPQNDEWEKFQRAIREESTVSSQILQDEEEESNTERQIEEIDEQLYKWSRVLSLEVKKEQVQEAVVEMQQHNNMKDDDGDSSYGSEEEFDEYLNWRSKSSFK